jgi:hypothetical protein
VHAPASAQANFPQGFQKPNVIGVVTKDRLTPVPAIQQMIDSSSELDSAFSRHDEGLEKLSG